MTGMNANNLKKIVKIRDTAQQDVQLDTRPQKRRKRIFLIGGGVLALIVIALLIPGIARLLSAQASVSASRLSFATVERGPFVRDVAADGRVVAAVSPTLYATSAGNATLKVNAGDTVKMVGTGHSFTNPDASKAGVPGVAYNKSADERSWKAMQSFFTEIFGG